MDYIVENFLEKKLAEEIVKARLTARAMGAGLKTNCTELNSILNDCAELSNKVLKDKKGTGRDKLYNLLNVITEWHDLSTKANCPAAMCSLRNLSKDVKQLKKDYEDELKKDLEDKLKKDKLKKDLEDELKKDLEDKVKKDLEDKLKKILEDEQASNTVLAMTEPQIYRWSCHAKSLAEIHGFDDRLKIMERLLLKPTPKPIGIVGVAGVGKTALCQLAYNYPSVKEHFPLRLWLCLSKNQDDAGENKDYLKMMMSCLGYEDQVIQKISDAKLLQVALQRHLERGRYLVVLDDVWIEKNKDKDKDKFVMDEESRKVFDFLKQPLGTLVVTSRSPELEEMLGADNIDVHKLLPLGDEDSCLKIFKDALKVKPELSKDEEKGIVEKCGGLPLMAKMLGEIGPPPPEEETSKSNEKGTTLAKNDETPTPGAPHIPA